ncbi:MAG: hypothetical protein AAGD09_12720, partial [Cyanobacteria bacterium P01_F01_bin.56]
MINPCGCCAGLEPLTPQSTANRPGLDQLRYRIGTHAVFLETMKARLSLHEFSTEDEAAIVELGDDSSDENTDTSVAPAASTVSARRPLQALKTRDSDDFTIALLDAWALVADVLTFYQERIANEGYLRTATERRSLVELGRLVGYKPRPGVSATVYPAFMMEQGYGKGSEVPQGTRIQSMPAPGEMPQFFETSERIDARVEWNELKPRLTKPQDIAISTRADGSLAINQDALYFEGALTNLKANAPLLFVDESRGDRVVRYVKAVVIDNVANQTKVTLQADATDTSIAAARSEISAPDGGIVTAVEAATSRARAASLAAGRVVLLSESLTFEINETRDDGDEPVKNDCAFEELSPKLENLTRKPSRPPANRQQLDRSPQRTFKCQSDIPARILTAFQPRIGNSLYRAWENTATTDASRITVYTFDTQAAPFGHNAPLRQDRFDRGR